MKYSTLVLMAAWLAIVSFISPALAHDGEHAGISFGEPHNGAVVPPEFKVVMNIDGMQVEKAGEAVPGSGHHHLIIDGDCIDKGGAVPKDDLHRHFGKGQQEATLLLAPGEHTLTLQFANGLHKSYGRDWCQTIHVTVE